MEKLNFITVSELNNDIVKNLHKLPQDVDVIVGVPRSGMLVATLISLYMNKPLADINGILKGEFLQSGSTKNVSGHVTDMEEVKKILVVEDSVASGKSILEVKEKMSKMNNFDIFYLAVYVWPKSKELVDLYFKEVEFPRMFEWNYMHHTWLENACFDIDGVLCVDPTSEENDDGERYIEFLKNVRPKFVPTRKIGWLVSSRLEKYRKETEEWLRNNNIEYGKLILLDLPTAEERRRLANHAEYKAEFYKNCDAEIFVESEKTQAIKINELSDKPVFCIENQRFYQETSRRTKGRENKKKMVKILKFILPSKVYSVMKKIYASRG